MIKKTLYALVFLLAGFTHSRAGQALGQLEAFAPEADISAVPEAAAVPEDKGWDPSAPYSFHQNRGLVLSRAGGITLGNVRWGGVPADRSSYDWRRARLDPRMLKKVYYGYKTSGVGHSLFVFVFDEGGFADEGGADGAALTAGAEGWTREPGGYNVLHGFTDRYPLIWNLTTFESYADYTVKVKESELFLAEINIGPGESGRLLSALLDRIDRTNADGEFYHSASNNCTTNPVALLNSVLPENKRVDESSLGMVTPAASLPALAVRKYRRLGVLSRGSMEINAASLPGFDIRGAGR